MLVMGQSMYWAVSCPGMQSMVLQEPHLHIASLSVKASELPHDAVQSIADALISSQVLMLQQSSMAPLQL